MSALGQKQTGAVQAPVSALPSKAEIEVAQTLKAINDGNVCLMTRWLLTWTSKKRVRVHRAFFGYVLGLFGTALSQFLRPSLEHLSDLARSFAANSVTLALQICERCVS